MKLSLKDPLVFCGLVLLIAVAGITLLATRQSHSFVTQGTQWISTQIEGFSPRQLSIPQCPPATTDPSGNIIKYSFYTDKHGESLCCNGSVNSLSHTCTPAKTATTYAPMCAFRTGVPDPIQGGTATLPLCSQVVEQTAKTQSDTKCPPSLKNYASGAIGPNGAVIQTCCKNGTNNDGTNCTTADLQSGNFCRIGTLLDPSDKSCAILQLYETSACPPTLQKTMYTLGATETKKYPTAAGAQVPLCFGVEHSCFPDNAVNELQKNSIFTSEPKDPKNWAFACSGYTSKYVDKLATGPDFQETYLK
jgi:hypothetical protein